MGGHAGPCHSDCFVNWSGPGSLDPASQKCSFFASRFFAYLGGNWEDRKISEIWRVPDSLLCRLIRNSPFTISLRYLLQFALSELLRREGEKLGTGLSVKGRSPGLKGDGFIDVTPKKTRVRLDKNVIPILTEQAPDQHECVAGAQGISHLARRCRLYSGRQRACSLSRRS
jgi:hypothetical protein